MAQVVVDGALFHAERLGDLTDGQPLRPQGLRARRRGLGRAWSPSGVQAALPGQGDAGGLALLGVLQFNLGNTTQQTGDEVPHRAAEVDLLRDRDHPHPGTSPPAH